MSTSVAQLDWQPPAGKCAVNVGASFLRALQLPKNFPASGSTDDDHYSFKYKFRPESVDATRPGRIDNLQPLSDGRSTFQLERGGTQNERHIFTGTQQIPKDWECVLIYDEDTQSFTLERLDACMNLTYDQALSKAARNSPPSFSTSLPASPLPVAARTPPSTHPSRSVKKVPNIPPPPQEIEEGEEEEEEEEGDDDDFLMRGLMMDIAAPEEKVPPAVKAQPRPPARPRPKPASPKGRGKRAAAASIDDGVETIDFVPPMRQPKKGRASPPAKSLVPPSLPPKPAPASAPTPKPMALSLPPLQAPSSSIPTIVPPFEEEEEEGEEDFEEILIPMPSQIPATPVPVQPIIGELTDSDDSGSEESASEEEETGSDAAGEDDDDDDDFLARAFGGDVEEIAPPPPPPASGGPVSLNRLFGGDGGVVFEELSSSEEEED
ncbi:hypothetical protein BOTBODRAFT_26601 [Botryobasidium botryosum FD-172 SS1]|uniref:Transcription elongation factor Eaf N-terminal domain-containing protein n=1 Tax=Botryobasidium botryosum (strain FD-172 SS1) TaxID=930990 RepID=A0A067N8Y8_BOTB1|nr:hypothetical protein BOTBODRAFT_26601 [Botryobasidium botryosum FD-172 SS1]